MIKALLVVLQPTFRGDGPAWSKYVVGSSFFAFIRAGELKAWGEEVEFIHVTLKTSKIFRCLLACL
jgi:hypothetical protein